MSKNNKRKWKLADITKFQRRHLEQDHSRQNSGEIGALDLLMGAGIFSSILSSVFFITALFSNSHSFWFKISGGSLIASLLIVLVLSMMFREKPKRNNVSEPTRRGRKSEEIMAQLILEIEEEAEQILIDAVKNKRNLKENGDHND